jgi:hypothetical protein
MYGNDVIKVGLKETVLKVVEWIRSPQDRDQWWILVVVITVIITFLFRVTWELHD